MKLGFVLGYGGSMIGTLKEVLEEIKREMNIEYEIIPTNIRERKDPEKIEECDAILIYTSKEEYDEVISRASSKGAKVFGVDSPHAHLSNVSPQEVFLAAKYLRLGGKENLRALCLLMLKSLGENVEVPPPVEIPWEGIYHPKYGTFFSVQEYSAKYPLWDMPRVGILFYRSDYVYGRTWVLDALISELESLGLGVLPVFTYGFKDERMGIKGTSYAIKTFFLQEGKPNIDVMINLTSFFVVDHGRSVEWAKEGYKETEEQGILIRLGVPIIQPIIMYYKSPEEWRKDEKGISPFSLVYRVCMPEVDGAIGPIVIAGSRVRESGEKELIPIQEQIRYLARRALHWIKLRRKRPEERKIAVILINPPCKNLEANVGVGLGLDVPESVVRFLRHLKALGYDVKDIPSSGEELIKIILERKAISEFRWTPVEEIVSKGGAIAFVDERTYMKWYEELPKEVKDRMREVWGDPSEVLKGKRKDLAGMVYKGRFVIPGVSFGNVLIIPQPKRGCAGPKCDGKVCKILHDPTIPPPHQWLAVYRWLSEVWGADLILHFGTHGYLEFLPGKGVGLSPSCWPQISIGEIPHLYVYAVSNPMEGVIAKRRGYATIVDHIYPPMSMGKGMEELERLLEEYDRAKSTGSEERLREIMKKIEEVANGEGIKGSGEELILEIRRRLHEVGETQINLGLHVFGDPPKGRKLAEYVATIMANDTSAFPSLRRTFAELLGLNYEELLERPEKVNEKYGISNETLLRKIQNSCVNVLERLLSKESPSEEEIVETIEEEIAKWKRQ